MKTWVNGELLNADKMNTLEQSVPASATSSNGVVTFKNGNGTDLFSVDVSAPAPTNMITNGDFSVAGATTDGWSSNYAKGIVSIADGKLVLSCVSPSNVAFGVQYDLSIQSGHVYLIRFKFKKTLGDSDPDGKVVRIMFGSISDEEICRKIGLTQNTIVENVCAVKADAAYTNILICFGGGFGSTGYSSGDSLLELFFVEMYDITDIVAGWTA